MSRSCIACHMRDWPAALAMEIPFGGTCVSLRLNKDSGRLGSLAALTNDYEIHSHLSTLANIPDGRHRSTARFQRTLKKLPTDPLMVGPVMTLAGSVTSTTVVSE